MLIVLAALVVACGGDDEATPAATEEATERATATESADGGDEAEQTFSSSQLPVSVTVTVPGDWEHPSDADAPDVFAVIKQGPGSAQWIDFLQPTQFYSYSSETQSELGGPPADYVAWFKGNPFNQVLSTEDVTIGGLQGTRIELKNPGDPFSLFKLSDGTDYHMSYLDHIYAHVLDADGTQIIVSCGAGRGFDFATFAPQCEEALSTVKFGTS
jgi:hypothetical protein